MRLVARTLAALAVLAALALPALANSLTPNKSLNLPQVNGDSNVWGALINATTSILDSNLGGLAAVPITSPSTTASAVQAQNLVLQATGLLTQATTLLLPAKGGFFIIDNETTGAFSLTVLTTAGGSTGVAVTQGTRAFVYSDGTNINQIVALPSGAAGGDLAGSMYPNPTIAAGAITSTKIAAGAAATNVGALGGALSGTLPNPTMAAVANNTALANTTGGSAGSTATNLASIGASKVLLPNGCAAASNSANVFFFGLAGAGFSFPLYEIEIIGAQPASNGAILLMQVSENNGSSYIASGYQYAVTTNTTGAAQALGGSGSSNAMHIGVTQSSSDIANVTVRVVDPLNLLQAASHYIHYFGSGVSGAGTLLQSNGMAAYTGDTGAINAVQFFYSTGNINKGSFCIYGIRSQ